MTKDAWEKLQDLSGQLSVESARFATDNKTWRPGGDTDRIITADVNALSRIIKQMKKVLAK